MVTSYKFYNLKYKGKVKSTKLLLNFPTPSYINYHWNYGSLLGLSLIIQLSSGFFLATFYAPNVNISFSEVIFYVNDSNHGWLIRLIHSNGASLFFIFCYLHIGKALYYDSFLLWKPWLVGVMILFCLMGTAFLGYVLPWGQMSYWGATVITNLISVVPFVGGNLVEWLWGGFNIQNATLTRFYSLHFLLPFVIAIMVMIHIMVLHTSGSSNPLGLSLYMDKVVFSPFFFVKDLITALISLIFFFHVIFSHPYIFFDVENFMNSNPMVTPIHIQPEWYFLFAYAILRAIPSKIGGVVMLVTSIMILCVLPCKYSSCFKGSRFNPLKSITSIFHYGTFVVLTWLGSMVVEYPFIEMSKFYTFLYFIFYMIF